MKKPAKLYRHGKFVRMLDDSESDYYCRDGESLSFGMQFMDSMDPLHRAMLQDAATPSAPLHRPGSLTISDAERDRRADMYDAQKARLSNAYRDVPPLAATPHADAAPGIVHAQPSTGDAVEDAYTRRNVALQNAWQTGGAA